MTSLPIAKGAIIESIIATTMKDAFSTESNILPPNMIGNTILVAVPGYRNVVHITTKIIDDQVQPTHYAVKSAFMPYDKDYRANYRSMLATKLLSRGDHNEASGEIQKEAPIKIGNEATGTNFEKYDSAKQRKDKEEEDETDKEVERYNGYYFKPIDPCHDTKFRVYGEYKGLNQVWKPVPRRYHYSKDDETSSYSDPRLYDDGSDVSGRSTWESGESIVFHIDPPNKKINNVHRDAYTNVSGRSSWESSESIVFRIDHNKKIVTEHGDVCSYASGRSSWESGESIVFDVDQNKKIDNAHGDSYSNELERLPAKSYTQLQKIEQCDYGGNNDSVEYKMPCQGSGDCVRDGESPLSYFKDGVLEEDTVDIDYDYYFVDEWGCVSGRNDESCFWKY